MSARLKKGDEVIVVAGRDRGHKGKILSFSRDGDRVLVEGRNLVKKHQKPRAEGEVGSIREIEAPIHVSNVMPIDPESGKGTRVRFSHESKGSVVRVAARSGKPL